MRITSVHCYGLESVVVQAARAAEITSSPNPSMQDQPVTLTLTATLPIVLTTGHVTLKTDSLCITFPVTIPAGHRRLGEVYGLFRTRRSSCTFSTYKRKHGPPHGICYSLDLPQSELPVSCPCLT